MSEPKFKAGDKVVHIGTKEVYEVQAVFQGAHGDPYYLIDGKIRSPMLLQYEKVGESATFSDYVKAMSGGTYSKPKRHITPAKVESFVKEAGEVLMHWFPDSPLSQHYYAASGLPKPPPIPESFRAKLADEWELKSNGNHIRKATWNGTEFVAIRIVERNKSSLIVDLRCPGREMTGLDVFPSGWSKKDRRYLSQLWSLWSEHHQEVPGPDWEAVTKTRLGL